MYYTLWTKYKNGEYDKSKEKPKEEWRHNMPINDRNITRLNYQSYFNCHHLAIHFRGSCKSFKKGDALNKCYGNIKRKIQIKNTVKVTFNWLSNQLKKEVLYVKQQKGFLFLVQLYTYTLMVKFYMVELDDQQNLVKKKKVIYSKQLLFYK